MKIGVIDIGSNSIRLMLHDGATVDKTCIITKLSENLVATGKLCEGAIERSIKAIETLKQKAISWGAERILAFARAAVRGAENGDYFVSKTKEITGVVVEVVSGETEAVLGLLGALNGKDGGIIDIGGASTEIIVSKVDNPIYSHSMQFGVVKLTELCGQNVKVLEKFIGEILTEYGAVPTSNFYGIGGTATSLSAIALELEIYDRKKVDGYVLTAEKLEDIIELLDSKTIEERKQIKGLQKGRAEVILSGAVLLRSIMKMLKIQSITISEDDNLEGYLIWKKKNEKKI